MKTLDWLAASAQSVRDPQTQLYPHFKATESLALAELDRLGEGPEFRSGAELFNSVLDLVAQGHVYLRPLTESYAVARAAHPDLEKNWAPYLEAKLLVQGRSLTVQQVLLERLAASAQLVAAAYQLAHKLSHSRPGGRDGLFATLRFGQSRAILDYPYPHYLKTTAPQHPCHRQLDTDVARQNVAPLETYSAEKL